MFFQSLVFLLVIILSTKYKGAISGAIAIAGVFFYSFFLKINLSSIPIEVPLVILSIGMASGALESSKGLDYIINLAENLIKKYPQKINIISPILSYFITFFTGSGHNIYAILPIVAKVSNNIGIKPEKPLSLSVIAAMQGLISSPISMVMVIILENFLPFGFNSKNIIILYFISTTIGLIFSYLYVSFKKNDFQKVESNLDIKKNQKNCKISAIIFFIGIIFAILCGSIKKLRPVFKIGEIQKELSMSICLILIMFCISAIISIYKNLKSKDIITSNSFISCFQASINILGLSWIGTTYVENNKSFFINLIKRVTEKNPLLFGLFLFFFCILILSQSATLKIFLPIAIASGLDKSIILSLIPAVSSVFVLPSYPTMIAAAQVDQTNSTKFGKKIINHSFFIPGLISTTVSTIFCYVFVILMKKYQLL